MVLLLIGLMIALCWGGLLVIIRCGAANSCLKPLSSAIPHTMIVYYRFGEWATQRPSRFSPHILLTGISSTLRQLKRFFLGIIARHDRIRTLVKAVLLGFLVAVCLLGMVLVMFAISEEMRLLRYRPDPP